MKAPEIKDFQTRQRGDVFYETEKSLREFLEDVDIKFLELLVNDNPRHAVMFTFIGVSIYKTRCGIMNFLFEELDKSSKGEYYFSKELIDDQLVFENFHRKAFPLRQRNGSEHLKQIEKLFKLVREKLFLSFDLMFTQIENQKSTQGWLEKNDYLFAKKGNELIGVKKF